MKNSKWIPLIITAAALSLAGCSSASKEESEPEAEVVKVEEVTSSTQTEKEEKQEAKEEVKEEGKEEQSAKETKAKEEEEKAAAEEAVKEAEKTEEQTESADEILDDVKNTFSALGDKAKSLASSLSGQSLEDIYNTYKAKLEAQGPECVNEYNQKAASLSSVDEKAELEASLTESLAETYNEGLQEMANAYLSLGCTYEEYEDWGTKLYDIYEAQGMLVFNAYMDSCM